MISRFPCPGCGAALVFDPGVAKLRCPYCGTTAEIGSEASGHLEELPLEQFASRDLDLVKLSPTALEVACASCGSVTEFEPADAAASCPFCAAPMVMQPKAADPLIAPACVLPFGLDKRQADARVQSWIGGLWFAPNDLKALARHQGMTGVYLPYWTFDARTTTEWVGARGDIYRDRNNQFQTRWSRRQGTLQRNFDDALMPATSAVQKNYLHALDPWPLDRLKHYEPAYLAGFRAQRYQIPLPRAWQATQQEVMGPAIDAEVRRQIGGDRQRVRQVNTAYSDVTFKHVLLPVWIGAYRYQSRVYQIVVNAQTGEVQGERPWSAVKVALAILVASIVFYFFWRN